MSTDTAATSHENRLARETSPYLLQHKHNPVDWWPWGTEALSEAQRANKPILLSVGYAACHWCHVMAHESFEDAATAQVMNDLFVNIKVDREERPDIDQIYMSALHHLGEHGGWPLTMFLTPNGEPFWGGTYFPKTSRYGKPAFVDLLREVERVFRQDPQSVEQNRSALMARLAASARPKGRVVIAAPELDRAANQIAGMIDPVNGGMRGAPKFPQPMMLEFLWRGGQRLNDKRYFGAVELTLTRICEGGIYDHLGGGFSRYSVDERWLVPHFEKMLYDNALLLELLALAYQRSANELFRRRAHETVAWLGREMTTAEGAFCASLDADSEGEEGKFYVWSLSEIATVLGNDDAAVFAAHYDVTAGGNFEGHNILNRLKHLPRSMEDEKKLAPMRETLLTARARRVRPGLDDKVLADWNGLMIAALVNAGLAFEEPHWLEMAARAFLFVDAKMTHGDRLGHSWRAGKLLIPGLASDHAAMIRAALALHEATGEHAHLERALAWQATLDRHYPNPDNGGYFLTADDAAGLVVRPNATTDDATPNPNAVAAQNLIRLAVFTGQHAWRDKADRLFEGIAASAGENLFAHLALLNALDLRLRAAEIVVAGEGARANDLLAAARKLPFLDRIVLRASPALPATHPAQEKIKATAQSAAFVCVGETCSLPVTEPDAIAAAATATRH
ncbi:MAG TPA: thioredoxin domain-containing protein [Xanthobacteraceae bacterium]|nr:thioredoxin domain-containing protein [Xanthobacteraceae bacterium]